MGAQRGEAVTYRNCASAGGTLHFCPVCGSTVYYTVDADDARIGVKIGAFATLIVEVGGSTTSSRRLPLT